MPSTSNPKLFVGQISRFDPATHVIHVDPHAGHDAGQTGLMQGIPLVNIFATTLGFRETIAYPVGAQVLCMDVTGGLCYILGIIPSHDVGDVGYWSRACLKTEDTNSQDADCNTIGYRKDAANMILMNNYRPTDVVEGEYCISNELGVLLGLFQQLAVLKGSELAQIQCYMLDDLVRLISHNFSHWTAAGEMNVYHDGKAIMIEYGATHLSRESVGIPQTKENATTVFKDEQKATPDDKQDFYAFKDDERGKAIERLKVFAGRLGDFLHLFLVRPDDEAQRTLTGETNGKFDRGLFDVHISTDGRATVRSVTGIAFEKTNWIRVPHRVRTPEDPEGDDADEVNFEKKEPFEWDNSYKVEDNPVGYFLQMRDCLAYTQDKYAYLNFEKYKKDFKLSNSPSDQEKSLTECEDIDPNTNFKFSDYQLRRSGIYFMDNGGLMFKDAWGSAIVMEGGNIYLQPTKDLVAQPLRHLVAKAGHSFSMAAKKHIDLSSTEEGLRVKTKKVQHFFAKDEGIILQTDTTKKSEPKPAEEAYEEFGGILLMAKESGLFSYAKNIFDSASDNSLYKAKETLTMASDERDVWIIPKNSLYLFPEKGNFLASSSQNLTLVSQGTAAFGGAGSTVLGNTGQTIGMISTPGSIPSSMDGVLPVDTLYSGLSDIRSIHEQTMQLSMSPFTEDTKFDEIKFRFLTSDKYDLVDQEDFIPMTIAQQDDASFNFLSLGEWKEEEVESTLPYPGKDKFENFYLKAGTLKNVKKTDQGNDYESKETTGIENKGPTLELATLNQYKVYE